MRKSVSIFEWEYKLWEPFEGSLERVYSLWSACINLPVRSHKWSLLTQVIPVDFDAYSAESSFKDALKVGHLFVNAVTFWISRLNGSLTWYSHTVHTCTRTHVHSTSAGSTGHSMGHSHVQHMLA